MKRPYHFCSGAAATLLAGIAIAIALSVPAFDAQGQTVPLLASERPVPLLKAEYLACDRAATRSALPPGAAAYCSSVSEELLERGFDGDFERLIAWWRSEKQAARSQARR